MKKVFIYLVSFLAAVTAPCPEAAGENYVNQSVHQAVRYIQGSHQYIVKSEYTITAVEETNSIGSGMLLQKTDGKFVVVKFKVSNKSAISVPTSILVDLILIDSGKSRWEQSLSATGSMRFSAGGFKKAQVGADKEIEDVVVFDVPENVKDYFILLPGGARVLPISKAEPPGEPVGVQETGRKGDRRQKTGDKAGKDIVKPTAGKITVTVKPNAVNLRERPSMDSEPVAWAQKGTVFEVKETVIDDAGRKWFKVEAQNGKECWIRDTVVRLAGAEPLRSFKAEAKTGDETKEQGGVKPDAAKTGHLKSEPPSIAKESESEKIKPPEKPIEEKKAPSEVKSRQEVKLTAVVTANAVHLRSSPSLDAGPVTWAVKGTEFEVTGEHREPSGRKWYRVKAVNGQQYWIVSRLVKVIAKQKAVVEEYKPRKEKEEEKAETAKPEPPIQETVRPGTSVPQQRKDGIAAPEEAKTESGIMEKTASGPVKQRTATVVVNTAVLREKPSFDSEKVAAASKGTLLEVMDEYTEPGGRKWYKVKTPKGAEHWIFESVVSISPFSLIEGNFIERGLAVIEPETTETKHKTAKEPKKHKKAVTVTSEFAVLKAEPSKDSKVITWASKGTVFVVFGEHTEPGGGKWYKVKAANDVECWISGGLVSLSTPVPDENVPDRSRTGLKPEDKTAENAKDKAGKEGKRNVEEKAGGKKHERQKEYLNAKSLQELLDRANVFYKSGKCEEFTDIYEKAIEMTVEQKDTDREGNLHYNVAECYAILGKYGEAIKHLDRSIAIARKVNNAELEILSFLGKNRVLIISGDRKNADEIFKTISERIDREIFLNISASDYLKALVSFQVAHILMDIGDGERARERADYALMANHNFKMEDDIIKLLKVVDYDTYEGINLTDRLLNKAWSSYEKGDFRSMEGFSREALENAKRLRYKRGMFSGNYYLAMSLSNTGEFKRSLDYALNAQEIAEKGGDDISLGMIYNLMGNIFKQENAYEKAMYYCSKYLEIAKKTGNREGEAVALNNIGNLLMDKGESGLALKYYEDSLKIILDLGSARHLLAQGYLSMGRAFRKLGEFDKAEENILLAKKIFSELGNEGGEVIGLLEMAANYGLRGEYTEAIKILEENLKRSEVSGMKQSFIEDLIKYAEKSNDTERVEKYRKMRGI